MKYKVLKEAAVRELMEEDTMGGDSYSATETEDDAIMIVFDDFEPLNPKLVRNMQFTEQSITQLGATIISKGVDEKMDWMHPEAYIVFTCPNDEILARVIRETQNDGWDVCDKDADKVRERLMPHKEPAL